jgi:LacI family transcriptional regulator
MVTIKEVARAAGVSPATVSRALNGRARVDPGLVSRVQAVAAQLGYRPSRVARNLRRRQTSVWGMVISDIRNPFFTDLVRAVEDVASTAGYSLVLCDADEDVTKEAGYLDLVVAERMAGAIVSPASPGASDLRPLVAHEIPVVLVDREVESPALDTVLVDNRRGARDAVDHLITNGYQRIACVTGPECTTTGAERLAGYRDALERAGRAFDPALVRSANFRERDGFAATRSLLELQPAPDALFVANNLMTLGALGAIEEAGWRIPTQIAVVGFDDMPWARLVRPALTTVAQPTYALGQETARLLLRRVQGDQSPPRRVMLATTLNVRGSSVRRV